MQRYAQATCLDCGADFEFAVADNQRVLVTSAHAILRTDHPFRGEIVEVFKTKRKAP